MYYASALLSWSLQNASTKISIASRINMTMENTLSTRQLLDRYYSGFARKEGWEATISDDFIFRGGDMNNRQPAIGKMAYIEVIKRFSRAFSSMRVKQMMVDGGEACVIGNYDFVFPNGESINGDVAEIWEAKDGQLTALTIYFDTLTFDRNTLSPA